jgi:hypothetical protein
MSGSPLEPMRTWRGFACHPQSRICADDEGRRAFVALHKVKVTSATYEERHIRSRGLDFGIHFGTLTLTLNESRQPMRKVRVAVIDVRERIHPDETSAVAAWACLHRIDMLTGFFGSQHVHAWVLELAVLSGAVSWAPMSQTIRSRGQDIVYPCFFLAIWLLQADPCASSDRHNPRLTVVGR